MYRLARRLGWLTVLALATVAPAQDPVRDQLDWFNRLVRGIDEGEKIQSAAIYAQLRQELDGLKAYATLAAARAAEGGSQFHKATDLLRQAADEAAKPTPERPAQLAAREAVNVTLKLGLVYAVAGDYKSAAASAEKAWDDWQRLPTAGRPPAVRDLQDTIATAVAAGEILLASDRPTAAQKRADDAAALCDQLPTPGLYRAYCRVLQGGIANRGGSPIAARDACRDAIGLLLRSLSLTPSSEGTIELNRARVELATALMDCGEGDDPSELLEPAEKYLDRSYPKGHPLRAAIYRLRARLCRRRGQDARAKWYIESARDHFLKLFENTRYERGHPELIRALSELGELSDEFGDHKDAAQLHRQAWDYCEKFYPPGAHAMKAAVRLALGRCLGGADASASVRAAEACFVEAESMARQLLPGARALLGQCLHERGRLLRRLGRISEAFDLLTQAHEQYRAVPNGHPDNLRLACDLGSVAPDALTASRVLAEALEADDGQLCRLSRAAVEVELLTYARPRREALAGLLAATRGDPAADQVYAAVWGVKAAVTRLASARREALRLLGGQNKNVRRLYADWRDVAARLRHAQDDFSEAGAEGQLVEQYDRLEVRLAPYWSEATRHGGPTPADLHAALPAGAAFLDFVCAAGQYDAFMLAPGIGTRRVALGDAASVDQDVNRWRAAVEASGAAKMPAEVRARAEPVMEEAGAALRRRIWLPLAAALPAGTTTIYVAADGALAGLPFGALPDDQPGSVLLERLAFAAVPHGAFLAEWMRREPAEGPGRFLALGGVSDDLADSVEGIDLARQAVQFGWATVLQGPATTSTRLCEELPKARLAHLTAHGFFDAPGLARERDLYEASKRDTKLVAGWGRRFPMSFVGLKLPGADGDLTGDAIAGLPLGGLRLVVLGACQTGRGDAADGEGVQSLQRAFHLAGCPNVVASLWDLPDAATRKLMIEFYRHLWDEHLPSAEALRQAQISVRRAGPRGQANPLFWAGLVHSGVGETLNIPLAAPVASIRVEPPTQPLWVAPAVVLLLAAGVGCLYRWRASRLRPTPL